METVIKTVITAILAGILILILKQSRPEYALPVQIAAVIVIFAACAGSIMNLIESITDFLPQSEEQSGLIKVIFKAMVIAIISKIGAEICRDSGGNALGFAVETAGCVMIIIACLPLFRMLTEIISVLLKG